MVNLPALEFPASAANDEPPPETERVFLQGGEVFASAAPAALVTILGSCVAVCLCDPTAGVGGMNHFLLAISVEQPRSSRYGDVACAQLLGAVLRLGARRGALRAKIFGGSGVMGRRAEDQRTLGEKNVELALAFLAAEHVPVVHGDVGGTRGRKLVFRTNDGAAWVKEL